MPLPPVPAIADADRYASYSPVVLTTQFNIPFPLFGDGTDIRVVLNGVTQTSGYTVLSPSGTLANLPRPVTDAYVLLTTGISSGTLEIFGARRPRRTVQATSPYSTRDFNVVFSDLISNMRELWSQFTRAIQVPIGEPSVLFPTQAARANKVLAFDAQGVPTPVDPSTGGVITAASIADSTTIGRALIKAPDTATALAAIGGTTDGIQLFTAPDDATARAAMGLGSAALGSVGVGPNNVVALDGNSRLPAVDGTQLTGLAPGQNAFINGNFDVWQFGTTVTPSLSAYTYVADGWLTFQTGAAVAVSRNAALSSPTNALKNLNGLTITGGVGNTQTDVVQRIEAARVNAGLRSFVCVSGYLINNTGSTITSVTLTAACPTAIDNWGTQNQRAGVTQTVNIPNNTAQRVTWTFDASAFTDGEKGLQIIFRLPGVTAGSATWTGMKCEPVPALTSGPTAIEVRHPSAVLAECQRYYEKTFAETTAPVQNAGTTGAQFLSQLSAASGTAIYGPFPFKVTKRAVPTITVFNPLAATATIRNITNNQNFVTSTGDGVGVNQFSLSGQAAGTSAQTDRCALHWTADARL